MAIESASDEVEGLIAELGRKYIWWRPIGNEPPSDDRVIAQAMNLGTFDDVRRMEKTLGSDRLAAIMVQAEPGWFSGRSWEFWRGRLLHRTPRPLGKVIPEEPPRRSLDAQAI
jgi:hypothetical protein